MYNDHFHPPTPTNLGTATVKASPESEAQDFAFKVVSEISDRFDHSLQNEVLKCIYATLKRNREEEIKAQHEKLKALENFYNQAFNI